MKTAKQTAQAAIDALGLTVESTFVPWSQSRNRGEKSPSLNWIVTVKRNGRPVLTTEYMAGSGHCPHYRKPVPANWNRSERDWQPLVLAWECENGFKARADMFGGLFRADNSVPILPDATRVIYSLVMDSSVLDHATFESWAGEFGYDLDSRKGEASYRACLEIALKLRAAVGEAGLAALQDASQDY